MNEVRRVTCNAGVKDQRNSSYDSVSNICQEVTKIRTLIREQNDLQNITELRQHVDITSKIILSNDLVNNCFQQFKRKPTKINRNRKLRNKPYKIKIVYSTHEEQINSEKIENVTIAEIKRKTLLLTSLSKAFH